MARRGFFALAWEWLTRPRFIKTIKVGPSYVVPKGGTLVVPEGVEIDTITVLGGTVEMRPTSWGDCDDWGFEGGSAIHHHAARVTEQGSYGNRT